MKDSLHKAGSQYQPSLMPYFSALGFDNSLDNKNKGKVMLMGSQRDMRLPIGTIY